MIGEGWQGRTVDGRFLLLEWLGAWANRCVFLTARQGMQKANIKLVLARGVEADAYLTKWETAKALSHPALLRIMETGRSQIDGTEVVYAVTEKVEGLLSEAVPRNALDPIKARSMFDPIVDALAFVHEKGLVHGSVKPANIVFAGNQWKLASDEMVGTGELAAVTLQPDIYDAPEVGAGNLTTAADVWSLGIIMVEAFAQRIPASDSAAKSNPEVPGTVPQPFREIARRCLQWNAADRASISAVRALLARDTVVEPVELNVAGPMEPETTLMQSIPAASRALFREGDETAQPIHRFGESEPAELTPRPRLFSNLIEEDERRSRRGRFLFALFVLLLVGVAVLGVRYKDLVWRSIGTLRAPSNTQPSSQTTAQPATDEARSQNPSPAVPEANQITPSADAGKQASSNATPPTTGAEVSNAPSQAEKQATAEPEKKEPNPAEQPVAPPPANSEGAVAKRVLPEVSPGAAEAMRGPVQVELRVSVNEEGKVAHVEYMTQGPGNYFARVAHQAAESWVFDPPRSEGRPRASVWTLRFRFDHRTVDVTATELR